MMSRLFRRLKATFTGPSIHDLLVRLDELGTEVATLRAEVDRLKLVSEPFHTRPGVFDPTIYAEVFVENEYRLPERFGAEDLVIDVGAHIGSFATACLMRGVGRVVAFEPFPANHALASVNLARFGSRAEVRRTAVWRSDQPAGRREYDSSAAANTGGGHLFGPAADGLTVPTVPLDEVVGDVLAAAGRERLRLLKLDCEGSEYPVLLTATCLGVIDEVCGEYHEVGPVGPGLAVGGITNFTHQVLVDHLSRAGFRVTAEPNPRDARLGWFWARR
jgi:FkbM family methyltransferase